MTARWIGAGVGMALATAVAVTFAETATAPATTAPSAHDAAFWNTLREHLQLAAQAQRDLMDVGLKERDKLKRLAEGTKDPEVKAQVLSRVEALDEELAINPPPLSIDVKDATLSDVAAALKGAMGVPFDSWPPNGQGRSGSYTLKVEGKGFWEIFAQLSEQHPLRIQNYNGTRLEESKPGLHRFVEAPSGMAIFPLSIVRSRSVDPQKPEGKEDAAMTLMFNYGVGVDPRMKIVKYAPPVLEKVKDDAGNDLLNHAEGSGGNLWDTQAGQCFFEQNTMLLAPANLGKRLALVKGHAAFLVELAEDRVEVDPKDVLNKPIAVGEHSATISAFKVENGTINFQIQVSDSDGGGMGVSFIDANGQVVWSQRTSGGTGGSAGSNFVEPVKVRFEASRKTKLLTVPFELKDLPLP